MTPLGRLLMRHNAVIYGDQVHFVGGCSKMSVTEFLSWARTVEFALTLAFVDDVPASNVIQFPSPDRKPCDVE